MSPRDVPHQRQPQAGSLDVMDQRVAAAVELLENPVLFVRRDSDPPVAHFQLHAAVGAVQADADEFLVLRILQGVVDQVEQRTGDSLPVHSDRRNVAGNILLKGKAVLFDLKTIGIEGRTNQFGEISLFEVVFLTPGFYAGEVQDVVDESGQTLALLANDNESILDTFPGP